MRISSGAVHSLPATKHQMQSIQAQLQLLASTKDVLCTSNNIKDGLFLYIILVLIISSAGSEVDVLCKNRLFIDERFIK